MKMGRDSSVGIVNYYQLDGPMIESLWGAGFSAHVQAALTRTQPPIQRVLCLPWE